jgi:hypothetical protein
MEQYRKQKRYSRGTTIGRVLLRRKEQPMVYDDSLPQYPALATPWLFEQYDEDENLVGYRAELQPQDKGAAFVDSPLHIIKGWGDPDGLYDQQDLFKIDAHKNLFKFDNPEIYNPIHYFRLELDDATFLRLVLEEGLQRLGAKPDIDEQLLRIPNPLNLIRYKQTT